MYASIDIGTNSVLLLIAKIDGTSLEAVCEEMRITRLGEGTADSEILAENAIDRTLAALAEYVAMCREMNVEEISAVGTASLRRAKNAQAFISRVRNELGISVGVISDEREAWLTYLASADSFGTDIVVMDIGGGSTEFIVPDLQGKNRLALTSFDLGVVGLTEEFFRSDPVEDKQYAAAQRFIRSLLSENLDAELFGKIPEFVATAGTATTLAAMHVGLDPYDPTRVHGMKLTEREVAGLIDRIRGLTTAQLREIKGLQRGREDVILAGALITIEAMKLLGYETITISDRGVRWGLLIEKHAQST